MNGLKMIPCSNCGADMPELRLTQYGYDFCVNCSESENKVGRMQAVPIMMGEGDHTWIETVIMTPEQYARHQKQEQAELNLDKKGKAEMQDMDDDKNLYGPVVIKNTNGK
tara:strand:+ start:1000 stop:1329 length:330 start_codon:yes stop_codon:yes gene_type:complete